MLFRSVAHGPSCSAACRIFPDQGSNPCPPHWQADSQPLRHQGSPTLFLKKKNKRKERRERKRGENITDVPLLRSLWSPCPTLVPSLLPKGHHCYEMRVADLFRCIYITIHYDTIYTVSYCIFSVIILYI